jgi:hypothetical protein
MKVIVCNSQGVVLDTQPPDVSEVHIVSNGNLVTTFKKHEGNSALVINADYTHWIMVDMND